MELPEYYYHSTQKVTSTRLTNYRYQIIFEILPNAMQYHLSIIHWLKVVVSN